MLKNIYENKYFKIFKDNKGYDFKYIIENKQKKKIKIIIELEEFDFENLIIKEWIGLFNFEENIIENIIKNNYKIEI